MSRASKLGSATTAPAPGASDSTGPRARRADRAPVAAARFAGLTLRGANGVGATTSTGGKVTASPDPL
ncbi:hypothetical protein JQ604_21650 [Bradyrhizobium jicamae]|uniref:hypothetical protein n=1 Tax=Bradyrhizobium jicamae TaxID=280332 RepID=UPI001BA781F1|nr:hypothetical protein [Bradyrhizobium jicamae]MBR0754799.1 hypothetical protein [Bradyrhizobium jicamae]